MQTLLAFFFIVLILFIVIILVIAALGASFVLRAVRFLFFPFKNARKKDVVIGADGHPVTDVMVKDPVCGTYLPKSDALRETIEGSTHFFCSQECLAEFKRRS